MYKKEERINDSCRKKKEMGLCSKDHRNEQHEKLIDIYRQFFEIRYCASGPGELADYNWCSLPENLPVELMPYSQMLFEHAQELPNSINDLYRYIVNLGVWKEIFVNTDEELKRELLIETITPFATLSINLIYVIKSRFFFSVAHLCHQANMIRLKKRSENLLPNDDEIY